MKKAQSKSNDKSSLEVKQVREALAKENQAAISQRLPLERHKPESKVTRKKEKSLAKSTGALQGLKRSLNPRAKRVRVHFLIISNLYLNCIFLGYFKHDNHVRRKI